MARVSKKNINTLAPKKKPKRRATSVAALKLGDEPSFVYEPTKSELVRALNWYKSVAIDADAHKAWVTEYLQTNGFSAEDIKTIISKIKRMTKTYIFVAHMINRGIPLDEKHHADALAYFRDIINRDVSEDEIDEDGNLIQKASTPKLNVKLNTLVNLVDEQVEAILKGGEAIDVYAALTAIGVNASLASQLKRAIRCQSDEFLELSKTYTCGEDLDEAYSYVKPKVRRALGAFFQKLNTDLDSFIKVAKATRKPRKKKAVKADKVVSRVKYKAKDDTFKIASVDPVKIVGASCLWTFNTKYRLLAYYEAGDGGLTVKGTTLQNYKTCRQKKLRKPEQQLAGFLSGGVKALPKAFDSIKTTETEPNGRINSDTILLRIF